MAPLKTAFEKPLGVNSNEIMRYANPSQQKLGCSPLNGKEINLRVALCLLLLLCPREGREERQSRGQRMPMYM